MASELLVFDDSESVSDLASFVARAKTVENDAALLVARGTALAVYAPVLVPEALGQGQFTILAMRAHRLAAPADVSASYSLASIQDRLARMGESSVEFALPPVELSPHWAGISVPLSGWEESGILSDDALRAAAESGIDAVATALPENPGLPVVAQVRHRIWSSPLDEEHAQLPLGAAFAMHAMGFVAPQGSSKLYSSGAWWRISNQRGHVLCKKSSLLG